MTGTKRKLRRRLALLDDLLDHALRADCRFAMCNGPEAPIRRMLTCSRCACIHRALRMGLVRKVAETYVREGPLGAVVGVGSLEQFSAIDGSRVP